MCLTLKRLLWFWGVWMHTAKKLPAVLFACSKRHACSDSAPLSWVWGHCSVTLSFFLWIKSPSHDLKPCTFSLFWISLGQLLMLTELLPPKEMRWTSGTGNLWCVPWWRVTKWGPVDPRTAAFSGELKEKYMYNFIGVFKGSGKAFQSQVQFVLNKSWLSSSIKSTCTVYSQYWYKLLPASRQINHASTLPHRMHLNLMSEETKEKTRSKSRTSVKEK